MKPLAGARAAMIPAAAALMAGCYVYVPVAPREPQPGTTIRADVNSQAASRIVDKLGPGVTQLSGMVLEGDDQTVAILVESFRTLRSADLSGMGEAVRIPFDGISYIEQKQLAKGRSILLGAAFVAGGILAVNVFASDSRLLEPKDDEQPGPIDIVVPRRIVPLLRIRFP